MKGWIRLIREDPRVLLGVVADDRAEPVVEPAAGRAAAPVADPPAPGRGDPFGAALDQLRNAGTDPATVDLVRQMLGQAGAAGQGTTSASTSTSFAMSGIDVRTPRGQFRGSGAEAEARLVSVLCGRFRAKTGLDAAGDPNARERIAGAARKAVEALMSGAGSYDVNLPFLHADSSGPKHLEETVRLEDLV